MEEPVVPEPKRPRKLRLVMGLLVVGIAVGICIIGYLQSRPVTIRDFKQCVTYGYPITGTSPQNCHANGATFVGSFVASPTPTSHAIAYQTVGAFSGSGSYAAKNDIINDQLAWKTYWDEIHAGSADKPQVPAVDFSRKTVIAISEGPFRSDAVGIEIVGVTGFRDKIVVTATEIKPGQTCAALATTLDPAVMIAIDTTALPITFDIQPHSRQCS